MRIAVISDIHGNCVALDAVLADVAHHPVDRWVCLGDAVQGGVQPLEVAERLHELGCPVVMGNADAFVLEATSAEEVTDSQSTVGRWTLETLGAKGAELIRSYVPTLEVNLGGGETMLCFHGSPDSFDKVLFPDMPSDELRKELRGHALEPYMSLVQAKSRRAPVVSTISTVIRTPASGGTMHPRACSLLSRTSTSH